MIRSYIGTVMGSIVDTYSRDNESLYKMVSNGYYCAVFSKPRTTVDTVYFSKIEAEIDEFVDKQVQNGYRKVNV